MMQPNFNQGFNQQQTWQPQQQQQQQQQQGQIPQVGIPVIRDGQQQEPQRSFGQYEQPRHGSFSHPNRGGQDMPSSAGPDVNQNLYRAFEQWQNRNWFDGQGQQPKSPGRSNPRSNQGNSQRKGNPKRARIQGITQRFNSWDDLNEIFQTFRPRVDGSF